MARKFKLTILSPVLYILISIALALVAIITFKLDVSYGISQYQWVCFLTTNLAICSLVLSLAVSLSSYKRQEIVQETVVDIQYLVLKKEVVVKALKEEEIEMLNSFIEKYKEIEGYKAYVVKEAD